MAVSFPRQPYMRPLLRFRQAAYRRYADLLRFGVHSLYAAFFAILSLGRMAKYEVSEHASKKGEACNGPTVTEKRL